MKDISELPPRELLFRNITTGCSNGGCIVHGRSKPRGMVTNGSCNCLQNFNRTQLNMLKSRLDSLLTLLESDND